MWCFRKTVMRRHDHLISFKIQVKQNNILHSVFLQHLWMYQFLLEADLSGDFHEQLLYQKCKQFLNLIFSFVMSAPSLTKFIQVEMKSLVQDFFCTLIMTLLQQVQYLSPFSPLLKCRIFRAMWSPTLRSHSQQLKTEGFSPSETHLWFPYSVLPRSWFSINNDWGLRKELGLQTMQTPLKNHSKHSKVLCPHGA